MALLKDIHKTIKKTGNVSIVFKHEKTETYEFKEWVVSHVGTHYRKSFNSLEKAKKAFNVRLNLKGQELPPHSI